MRSTLKPPDASTPNPRLAALCKPFPPPPSQPPAVVTSPPSASPHEDLEWRMARLLVEPQLMQGLVQFQALARGVSERTKLLQGRHPHVTKDMIVTAASRMAYLRPEEQPEQQPTPAPTISAAQPTPPSAREDPPR
eukprot:RCo055457